MNSDKGDDSSLDEAQGLLKRGRYEQCEKACDLLIEKGGGADTRAVRALARAFLGNHKGALSDLQGVARDNADATPYQFYALAKTHQLIGNAREALDITESILRRFGADPNLEQFRTSLLVDCGRYEEARIELRRQPSESAAEPEHARLVAIVARRLGKPQEALPALDRALGNADLFAHQKQQLLFEKGAVLDALRRYDEAFEAINAANALEQERFHRLFHKDAIDRTIKRWTPDSFDNIPGNETEKARPLFLVGMPRSGSTLIEQMLDCHSAIHCIGEGHWLLDAAMKAERFNVTQFGTIVDPRPLDADRLRVVAAGYLEGIEAHVPDGAGIIVDKTLTNRKLIGLIAKAFPGASIVWCRRNPLDTILSCYFQGFTHNGPYANLSDITRQYHDSERMLEHWRDRLGIPILEVRYENVVSDPRHEIGRILDYLDLPWEDACLDFHSSRRIARTVSRHQVNRPLYKTSRERWRNYAKQLEVPMRMLEPYGYIDVGSDHYEPDTVPAYEESDANPAAPASGDEQPSLSGDRSRPGPAHESPTSNGAALRCLLTIRDDAVEPGIIFANGYNQNIKFFYDLLVLLGHEPLMLINKAKADGFNLGGRIYDTATYDSLAKEDTRYDICFEVGVTLNQALRNLLRERFSTKIVAVRYGISMLMDMEQMSHNENLTPGIHVGGVDFVWTSPHIAYGLPYLETVLSAPGRVAPYVWEPDFVKRRFMGRGKMDVRDIYVMEPSISIVKHALIPLTIIEEVYRQAPDSFGKAMVLNGMHFNSRTYFLQNIVRHFSSALSETNKVFFSGRYPFNDVFKRPDLLLGHQWGCELNYLYLEALWAGIPLVHNSDVLAEVGYHYPGFDVHAGRDSCLQALAEHDEASAVRENARFLERYSIRNSEVQEGYRCLIEEVLDS